MNLISSSEKTLMKKEQKHVNFSFTYLHTCCFVVELSSFISVALSFKMEKRSLTSFGPTRNVYPTKVHTFHNLMIIMITENLDK